MRTLSGAPAPSAFPIVIHISKQPRAAQAARRPKLGPGAIWNI
jgi:hypothetical protein